MRRAHQEEVNVSGVQSDRHGKVERTDRRGNFPRATQGATHLGGGAGRAHGVIVAREEEQQRVATEFQQAAVALAGGVEHAAEDAAQRLDELLPADPAAPGQALGQRRETGDIREAERAVDHLPEALRRVEHPVDRELRNVAAQPRHAASRGVCMSPA